MAGYTKTATGQDGVRLTVEPEAFVKPKKLLATNAFMTVVAGLCWSLFGAFFGAFLGSMLISNNGFGLLTGMMLGAVAVFVGFARFFSRPYHLRFSTDPRGALAAGSSINVSPAGLSVGSKTIAKADIHGINIYNALDRGRDAYQSSETVVMATGVLGGANASLANASQNLKQRLEGEHLSGMKRIGYYLIVEAAGAETFLGGGVSGAAARGLRTEIVRALKSDPGEKLAFE